MKKRIEGILVLILFFVCNSVQAQDYLPLQIGNRWDFNNNFEDAQGVNHQEKSSSIIITKDSTMPNGKTYFFLDGRGSFLPTWVRVDTSWVFYYESADSTDYALYNFNAQIDDTLYTGKTNSLIKLKSRDTLLIFNQNTIRLTFINKLGPDNIIQIELSDKLGLLGGSYYYAGEVHHSELSGCIIGNSEYGNMIDANERPPTIINEYKLSQNYPNPFNPQTTISFTIPKGQIVELAIYDVLGRRLMTLLNEYRQAGRHQVILNSSGLSSGIYFYQLKTNEFVQSKKLVILK